MNQPPEKIYLQWYGQDADDLTEAEKEMEPSEVCWCSDKIFDTDVEYVRSAEIAALREAIREAGIEIWSRLTGISPSQLTELARSQITEINVRHCQSALRAAREGKEASAHPLHDPEGVNAAVRAQLRSQR